MKKAAEKQSDLQLLTGECDAIVVSVSPEGAANLRQHVADLRQRVTHLTDSVRSQINVVSDAIMQRYRQLTQRNSLLLLLPLNSLLSLSFVFLLLFLIDFHSLWMDLKSAKWTCSVYCSSILIGPSSVEWSFSIPLLIIELTMQRYRQIFHLLNSLMSELIKI